MSRCNIIGKRALPKFNMEPTCDGFQKESPVPGCYLQVNQPLNFGRVDVQPDPSSDSVGARSLE